MTWFLAGVALALVVCTVAYELERRRRPSDGCSPRLGIHYHGGGDHCECGEQPNVWATNVRAS